MRIIFGGGDAVNMALKSHWREWINSRMTVPLKTISFGTTVWIVSTLTFQDSLTKTSRSVQPVWLHRCWWRMLETRCVGDNFKMLVTVLVISIISILYPLTLALGTNIKRCHQDLNSVANNPKLSPTVSHQHHNITNMTVAEFKLQLY